MENKTTMSRKQLESTLGKIVKHLRDRAEFYTGDLDYYEKKEMNTFLTMDEQSIVVRDLMVLREIESIANIITGELGD